MKRECLPPVLASHVVVLLGLFFCLEASAEALLGINNAAMLYLAIPLPLLSATNRLVR